MNRDPVALGLAKVVLVADDGQLWSLRYIARNDDHWCAENSRKARKGGGQRSRNGRQLLAGLLTLDGSKTAFVDLGPWAKAEVSLRRVARAVHERYLKHRPKKVTGCSGGTQWWNLACIVKLKTACAVRRIEFEDCVWALEAQVGHTAMVLAASLADVFRAVHATRFSLAVPIAADVSAEL